MPNVSTSRSDHKVARALKRLEQLLGRQEGFVTVLSFIVGSIMADKDQVSASIADLKKAIQDDQTSDQAVVDSLEAANAVLQKKIDDAAASGNTQEADDLQGILDQINDAKSAIQPVSTGTTGGTTPSTSAGETNVPIQP